MADSGSRADPGLAFIEAPTLVVHGAADGLVPLAYGRRLASLIGNAAFHPIAGAGHMPMLEAENAFVGAVAAVQGAAVGIGMVCRGHCFGNGLIMRAVGDRMIIAPPLTMTRAQIDELMGLIHRCLDATLDELRGQGLLG